jgi:meiotic recombination protein REC8
MVLDDPAFLPDFELPPLPDFELLSLNFNKGSQRSSQSMMSIQRDRSGSVSSMSVAALNIPSSSRNSMLSPYQLPNNDPFALSSAHKPVIGKDHGMQDEELLMYNDEMPFEFDEAGNLRDISPAEINARHAGTVPNVPHRMSSSAASGRIRADHAVDDFAVPDYGDGDFGIQYGRDEELPDAEPFSQLGAGNNDFFMSGGLQRGDQPLHLAVPDLVSSPSSGKRSSEDPSVDSAKAPNKRRKTRTKKKIALDKTLVLASDDMRRMRDSYLDNMAASIRHMDVHKGVIQARKNAKHFLFGTGIMGVGNGLGSFGLISSLEEFSGDALMEKITGSFPAITQKRRREDAEKTNQDDQSPKRVREDDEVGRGQEEHIYNFDEDMPEEGRSSSGVEIGRDAPSALPDFPSSAMPWNVSASVGSRQRGLSSRRPGSMISVSLVSVSLTHHYTLHTFVLEISRVFKKNCYKLPTYYHT